MALSDIARARNISKLAREVDMSREGLDPDELLAIEGHEVISAILAARQAIDRREYALANTLLNQAQEQLAGVRMEHAMLQVITSAMDQIREEWNVRKPSPSQIIPRWIFLSLYFFSLLFYLTGCASTATGFTKRTLDKIFEDDPPVLDAVYEASPKMLPDFKGEPSPLVVAMYELKSLTEFNAAQFFPLYEDEKDILGDELVAFEEKE